MVRYGKKKDVFFPAPVARTRLERTIFCFKSLQDGSGGVTRFRNVEVRHAKRHSREMLRPRCLYSYFDGQMHVSSESIRFMDHVHNIMVS